jgi:hypothetical protein
MLNAEEEKKRGPSFTPQPGFVLRTFDISKRDASGAKRRVFVNICFHDACGKPLAPSGEPVADDCVRTDNLRVPLLVGPAREVQDDDSKMATCVDVVFHSWLESRMRVRPNLQDEVFSMALEWAEKEVSSGAHKNRINTILLKLTCVACLDCL